MKTNIIAQQLQLKIHSTVQKYLLLLKEPTKIRKMQVLQKQIKH